jgi:hypothetical protein
VSIGNPFLATTRGHHATLSPEAQQCPGMESITFGRPSYHDEMDKAPHVLLSNCTQGWNDDESEGCVEIVMSFKDSFVENVR